MKKFIHYENFRAWRIAANYTQQDIATILCVSRWLVGRWEAGDSVPSVDDIATLSMFSGHSIDSILHGHDPAKLCRQRVYRRRKTYPLII